MTDQRWMQSLDRAVRESAERGIAGLSISSYQWARNQRSRKLTPEQERLLDERLPGWRGRDEKLERQFTETLAQVAVELHEHGLEYGTQPYRWLNRNRKSALDGEFSPDRIRQLDEAIPDWRTRRLTEPDMTHLAALSTRIEIMQEDMQREMRRLHDAGVAAKSIGRVVGVGHPTVQRLAAQAPPEPTSLNVERAIILARDGATAAEIGRLLHVDRTTVADALDRRGIQRTRGH